jgi:predicted ABC-class ATPase
MGSGNSGRVDVIDLEQLVLDQTGVRLREDGTVVALLGIGLPARGRRILGGEARTLLTETLPRIVRQTLTGEAYQGGELEHAAMVNEDASALRRQLSSSGLVSFVADDSVLPRRSGVDQRPMDRSRAVSTRAPDSLAVTLTRPNGPPLRGLGIPAGVTLIVGGGYHGKSTLLEALVRGVYNHAPDDGREFVVTVPNAVAVPAEDGRAITGVDISDFIGDLPDGQDTRSFTTRNASGSTSQAAGMAEAVEAGATAVLIDEDTAATNFLIRDRRMQALVPKEREPITPLIDRVHSLHTEHGISTILVVGGSGDYFDVADTVIGMDAYRPRDLTGEAREVARRFDSRRVAEASGPARLEGRRTVDPASLDAIRRGRTRTRARGVSRIEWGSETIDVSRLPALLLPAQTRALVSALLQLRELGLRKPANLTELLHDLSMELDKGPEALDPNGEMVLAAVRVQEVAAALSRLRSLRTIG